MWLNEIGIVFDPSKAYYLGNHATVPKGSDLEPIACRAVRLPQ